MDINAGDKYLVEVHGWIMCKGVDAGKYRIEISSYGKGMFQRLTATFYKPKGKKPIARHYLSDILLNSGASDLNKTEIIRKLN